MGRRYLHFQLLKKIIILTKKYKIIRIFLIKIKKICEKKYFLTGESAKYNDFGTNIWRILIIQFNFHAS